MTERNAALAAAVRAGDTERVRGLLEAGAAPDAAGEDGLPVLCTAVAACDPAVAEALVEAGADPDRRLPDGTTPLLRAIEGGSPAVFEAALGSDPRLRLAPERRTELLAAARNWYEEGPQARLRHLTGDPGPVRTRVVPEGEYHTLTEFTLGGRCVRDGHGGILTSLEWAFRILTPPGELVARAVRHGDPEHADWWASQWILTERRSAETWAETVAFHRHPDPLPRLFVADVLGLQNLTEGLTPHARRYERERLALLRTWAEVEDDGVVLPRLLRALVDEGFSGAAAVGLRHAGHGDARVRRAVPDTFDRPLTPRTAEAVRDLCHDPDAGVRRLPPGHWAARRCRRRTARYSWPCSKTPTRRWRPRPPTPPPGERTVHRRSPRHWRASSTPGTRTSGSAPPTAWPCATTRAHRTRTPGWARWAARSASATAGRTACGAGRSGTNPAGEPAPCAGEGRRGRAAGRALGWTRLLSMLEEATGT